MLVTRRYTSLRYLKLLALEEMLEPAYPIVDASLGLSGPGGAPDRGSATLENRLSKQMSHTPRRRLELGLAVLASVLAGCDRHPQVAKQKYSTRDGVF